MWPELLEVLLWLGRMFRTGDCLAYCKCLKIEPSQREATWLGTQRTFQVMERPLRHCRDNREAAETLESSVSHSFLSTTASGSAHRVRQLHHLTPKKKPLFSRAASQAGRVQPHCHELGPSGP